MSRVLLLGLLAVAACGHSHGEDHLKCFGDEEAVDGAAKVGTSGALKVHVLSTNPDPMIVGENTVTIRITNPDDSANPAANLVSAETWQRVHDHGSPSEIEISALAGEGEFEVANMGIVHTGSWLFRFEPEADGATDFVEFNFGVECPAETQ